MPPTTSIATAPSIEFWFDFGSPYSYLSCHRIEAAAATAGVRVVWRPFLLGPVFQALGWQGSPFTQQAEKLRYMWQDMARQSRKYALPWRQPSVFPRRALLPLRVALLGAGQPWCGSFCRRIMDYNFVEDREIDNDAAVADALRAADLDPAPILAAARGEANKERLRAQTESARQRGIFGAPMFFVGTDMYWGNDRLDDALAAAAAARP